MPQYQRDPTSLSKLYVPSTNGAQVPLSAFTSASYRGAHCPDKGGAVPDPAKGPNRAAGERHFFTDSDGFSGIGVPAFGKIRPADNPCMNFVDDLDGVG